MEKAILAGLLLVCRPPAALAEDAPPPQAQVYTRTDDGRFILQGQDPPQPVTPANIVQAYVDRRAALNLPVADDPLFRSFQGFLNDPSRADQLQSLTLGADGVLTARFEKAGDPPVKVDFSFTPESPPTDPSDPFSGTPSKATFRDANDPQGREHPLVRREDGTLGPRPDHEIPAAKLELAATFAPDLLPVPISVTVKDVSPSLSSGADPIILNTYETAYDSPPEDVDVGETYWLKLENGGAVWMEMTAAGGKERGYRTGVIVNGKMEYLLFDHGVDAHPGDLDTPVAAGLKDLWRERWVLRTLPGEGVQAATQLMKYADLDLNRDQRYLRTIGTRQETQISYVTVGCGRGSCRRQRVETQVSVPVVRVDLTGSLHALGAPTHTATRSGNGLGPIQPQPMYDPQPGSVHAFRFNQPWASYRKGQDTLPLQWYKDPSGTEYRQVIPTGATTPVLARVAAPDVPSPGDRTGGPSAASLPDPGVALASVAPYIQPLADAFRPLMDFGRDLYSVLTREDSETDGGPSSEDLVASPSDRSGDEPTSEVSADLPSEEDPPGDASNPVAALLGRLESMGTEERLNPGDFETIRQALSDFHAGVQGAPTWEQVQRLLTGLDRLPDHLKPYAVESLMNFYRNPGEGVFSGYRIYADPANQPELEVLAERIIALGGRDSLMAHVMEARTTVTQGSGRGSRTVMRTNYPASVFWAAYALSNDPSLAPEQKTQVMKILQGTLQGGTQFRENLELHRAFLRKAAYGLARLGTPGAREVLTAVGGSATREKLDGLDSSVPTLFVIERAKAAKDALALLPEDPLLARRDSPSPPPVTAAAFAPLLARLRGDGYVPTADDLVAIRAGLLAYHEEQKVDGKLVVNDENVRVMVAALRRVREEDREEARDLLLATLQRPGGRFARYVFDDDPNYRPVSMDIVDAAIALGGRKQISDMLLAAATEKTITGGRYSRTQPIGKFPAPVLWAALAWAEGEDASDFPRTNTRVNAILRNAFLSDALKWEADGLTQAYLTRLALTLRANGDSDTVDGYLGSEDDALRAYAAQTSLQLLRVRAQ